MKAKDLINKQFEYSNKLKSILPTWYLDMIERQNNFDKILGISPILSIIAPYTAAQKQIDTISNFANRNNRILDNFIDYDTKLLGLNNEVLRYEEHPTIKQVKKPYSPWSSKIYGTQNRL